MASPLVYFEEQLLELLVDKVVEGGSERLRARNEIGTLQVVLVIDFNEPDDELLI